MQADFRKNGRKYSGWKPARQRLNI